MTLRWMTRRLPCFLERGLASWYGRQFDGRRTASGETYDMVVMTSSASDAAADPE